MEKLIKTSRVIDGFVKAFRGICFGFAVAVAILLAVELVLPQAQFEKFVTTSDMMVDFGVVEVHTARELTLQGPVRMTVALMLACAAVALGLAAWGLTLLHRILVPMREGRPFDGSVSVTLRKLGWVTLFGGLGVELLAWAVSMLELRLYDFSEIFRPETVTGYTVNIPLGGALIAPVVILLLSHVFQYGEQLQQQSDETL